MVQDLPLPSDSSIKGNNFPLTLSTCDLGEVEPTLLDIEVDL